MCDFIWLVCIRLINKTQILKIFANQPLVFKFSFIRMSVVAPYINPRSIQLACCGT